MQRTMGVARHTTTQARLQTSQLINPLFPAMTEDNEKGLLACRRACRETASNKRDKSFPVLRLGAWRLDKKAASPHSHQEPTVSCAMSRVEQYDPPNILRVVGGFLTYPRQEYSTDFARFIVASRGSVEQSSYRSGIAFLLCVAGSILFVWCFVLLWLKINSNYVGCAAGKPFQQQVKRPPKSSRTRPLKKRGKQLTSTQRDKRRRLGKAKNSANVNSKSEGSFPETTSLPQSSELGKVVQTTRSESYDLEEEGMLSLDSIQSSLSVHSPTTRISQGDPSLEPSGREKRSQICFLLFGIVAIACLPLILALCVKPLVAAAEDLTFSQDEANSLFNTSMIAVEAMDESYTNTIANKTTSLAKDLQDHCPNTALVRAIYSIDLEVIFAVVAPEIAEVDGRTKALIQSLQRILDQYSSVVAAADPYVSSARRYLWLPPVLLFSLSLGVGALILGVQSAWRRKSTSRYQNLLSYGVLPFVVFCVFSCWVFLLGSVISTSIVSDICWSTNPEGSPMRTIDQVLQNTFFAIGSPLYEYTTSMTHGCNSTDPALAVDTLSKRTESLVEIMRSTLLLINTAGSNDVASLCNNDFSEDNEFISSLPRLIDHYSTVQVNLDTLADTLSCENTHELFTNAVEESLCTDIASALSWACALFLLLGVSTMVIITLRASWRHHPIEEKIYDENEVAENMILDEHEEYLVYISKFRHEWEEYQGLDAGLREEEKQLDPQATTESERAVSPSKRKKFQLPPNEAPEPTASESIQDSVVTSSQSMTSEEQSQLQGSFDPYVSDSQSMSTSADSISFMSLKADSTNPASPQQQVAISSLLITNQASSITSVLDDDVDDLDLLQSPSNQTENNVNNPGCIEEALKRHIGDGCDAI